jgi:hypothetical protein
MRSGLVAALMGIGGIFAAFGTTILVIAIFSRMNSWQLPKELSTGTLSLVVGLVMFAAGFLLNRVGRSSSSKATA